ncbi:hypothetical protein GQ457_14G024810 [Hibiscus cannabinus]
MEIVGQQHGSMQWPAPLHPSTVCSIREGVVNPVRHALIISHSVRSQMMAKHTEEALGLDIKPGSPNIFYSCGGDGLSINDGLSILRILHVDHIAVDPMNLNIFAVAGLDKYNRLYDIRKSMRNGSIAFSQIIDHFYPPHLIGGDLAGVTGMAFSDQSELLVSYSDNSLCLFTRDMGNGHDPYPFSPFSARSESSVKVISQLYKGSAEFESAKGVTFLGTKSEYVVMGSDFGRIFIWKKKGGELVRVMETDEDSVNFISLRMRSDKIDTIFIPFHNTDKLTSFLLPNKYSAIIGSHNHILRFGA